MVGHSVKLQQSCKLLEAPIGRNMKKWSAKAVSRLVRRYKKYTGEWAWGATTTIRDGKGRKKASPDAGGSNYTYQPPGLENY